MNMDLRHCRKCISGFPPGTGIDLQHKEHSSTRHVMLFKIMQYLQDKRNLPFLLANPFLAAPAPQ